MTVFVGVATQAYKTTNQAFEKRTKSLLRLMGELDWFHIGNWKMGIGCDGRMT